MYTSVDNIIHTCFAMVNSIIREQCYREQCSYLQESVDNIVHTFYKLSAQYQNYPC